MKNFKKVLALVLVLATLMGLATVAGAAYKDADEISADYTEATKVLELIETMEGYPDGSFGPKKTITREEAAKLIAIFDNKDADIETYYTSINPFADEKGRWGESYVGYGFRAGIIAGMNATTFAPTANVTGTQFLKMVLVTLGYDAEAEGFVGASWAVNVLALAKRIGLVDDLADGWKAENDLTREEAAQILLNALETNTVEYGSEVKTPVNPVWSIVDGSYYFDGRFYMTVAGAVSTGDKLYEDFDLKKTTSSDAFYRPTTKWTLNQDSVSVMWNPKATFTTEFSACDLLVALGVDKKDQDTTIIIDAVYCDGAADDYSPLLGENADFKAYKVDEYTALSGSKFTTVDAAHFGAWHHENAACKDPSDATVGAQGTLTQVFYVGKDSEGNKHYVVCSIETWLGKVTSVKSKTNAYDGHLKGSDAVKFVPYFCDIQWNEYNGNMGYCTTETAHCSASMSDLDEDQQSVRYLTYDDPEGLAKDDYVLFTYSFKDEEVVTVEVTEGKAGRLSGYKMGTVASFPTETRIDGEYVTDAAHFHLGFDASKTPDYGPYVFFYDAYGNVIGMTDDEDTSVWGVADRLWITFTGEGEEALNAKTVGLDAEFTTSVVKALGIDRESTDLDGDLAYTVARLFNVINTHDFDINDFAFLKALDSNAEDFKEELITGLLKVAAKYGSGTNGESYKDFDLFYDHLYKLSTDSNGKLTIAFSSDVDWGYGAKLTKGKAYVTFKDYETDSICKISTDANTQYLVHVGDGLYEDYTGYKNVESIVADRIEYVENEDGIAEVVYLTGNVCFTKDKFFAYVGNGADIRVDEVKVDGADYFVVEAYVNGVKTELYIEHDTMEDYFNEEEKTFKDMFYEFQYVTIDDITIVRVVGDKTELSELDLNWAHSVDYFDGDILVTEFGDTFTMSDDCVYYGIYEKGVMAITADEIEELVEDGMHIAYCEFSDDDDEVVVALYLNLFDKD